MDSIAINSETFTPEGRDAGGLEIGELELLFQGCRFSARARRFNNGDIEVAGFIGHYRTSNKPWRATVLYRAVSGEVHINFGRDYQLDRFSKQEEVSFKPEIFKARGWMDDYLPAGERRAIPAALRNRKKLAARDEALIETISRDFDAVDGDGNRYGARAAIFRLWFREPEEGEPNFLVPPEWIDTERYGFRPRYLCGGFTSGPLQALKIQGSESECRDAVEEFFAKAEKRSMKKGKPG
ncbi:hypothetical protein F9K91_05045 [Brucella tritici]|uniref:Uncharacterized protein n=1 Tax=Brucella tritici TaxID=94626 RepID=A0A833CNE1_9HYPH|nr:hypothetical protein [Brucella tritici]KAB2666550.1 hypothetical protein F9K91_05045 [Brucella tritici]